MNPGSTHIGRACIVMPTYNEADNITRILDRIDAEARQRLTDCELHVLIVDDNSPDGTADIVKARDDFAKTVHLLLRMDKEGLGAAYIHGMQHAIDSLEPDAILEMDADGSHDPSDIPRMLGTLNLGYDIVIGSRYVNGGTVPADWGMHRKLMSNAANRVSKALLFIDDVQDCTGGFRAIRSSILRNIDLAGIDTAGYVFQVALLDTLMQKGAIVKEIPIQFHDREAGMSKIGIRDVLGGGMDLVRIAAPRWANEVREAVA